MARAIVTKERKDISTSHRSSLVALSVGAFVGFTGWLLTLAINSWVLHPVFCRSADTASICSNSGFSAWIIAFIIASIAGLFLLIRANVFRPLLVVLAVLLTLWAVGLWFLPLAWWTGLLWNTIFFALAYTLYTWLASAERFVYAIVSTALFVVIFRILISY